MLHIGLSLWQWMAFAGGGGPFLLLRNGVDHLLLRNGTDSLLLAHS